MGAPRADWGSPLAPPGRERAGARKSGRAAFGRLRCFYCSFSLALPASVHCGRAGELATASPRR